MPDTKLDEIEGAPPAPPYEESGSLLKTQLIFGFSQLLAAAGAIIAFLGFGEATWVVRTYRFLNSHEATPVISVTLWALGGTILWFRAKRNKIKRAVMAALLPNRVAKLVGPVHPAIKEAIGQALMVAPSNDGASRRPQA